MSMSLIPHVLARVAGAHFSGMNGCQQVWMRVFLTLHTLRNFTKTELNLTIWLHTFQSVSWITFTANVCFPQSFQLREKNAIWLSHALFCTLGDLNICRWTVVVVLLKAGACQEKLNKLCLVSSPYYQKTDLWAMDLRFDPGDGSAV